MGVALIAHCAWVLKQETFEFYFFPHWFLVWVVDFHDPFSHHWDSDPWILFTSKIQFLVFKFRELNIEWIQSIDHFPCKLLISNISLDPRFISWKANPSRPLDKQHISLFIPILWVDPHIQSIRCKYKWAFAVQPTIEWWTARASRYSYN